MQTMVLKTTISQEDKVIIVFHWQHIQLIKIMFTLGESIFSLQIKVEMIGGNWLTQEEDMHNIYMLINIQLFLIKKIQTKF